MRNLGSLVVLAAAIAALSGLGDRARPVRATNAAAVTHRAARRGRLAGGIVFYGRVPRSAGKSRYHRGWVEVGEHGHLVAKRWVKTNRLYHFSLAPGTYDLAGYTRYGVCRTSATIHSDRTTHQDVGCVWH